MSLRKFKEKFQLRKDSVQTFFGIGNNQLDITTMCYRQFGAVWQIKNGYTHIIGYWFCDNENDLIKNINSGQWANLINQGERISDVYQAIRKEQEKELWEVNVKLPKKIMSQDNWREQKPGFYIVKSSEHFPCSLTCFIKTKNSLRIKHIFICESQNDISKGIDLINIQHNITLSLNNFSIL